MAYEDMGQELDWDMSEVDDSGEYVLIDPGVYAFMVCDLKKERFEGSAKIGPSPMAVVELVLSTDDPGTTHTITENMILNTKTAFKISQFFKSLGAKPDPETGRVPVDWSNVVGKQGRLELDHRTYTKRDGTEGKANNVKRFLAPSDAAEAVQTSIPVPEQPAQPQGTHYSI